MKSSARTARQKSRSKQSDIKPIPVKGPKDIPAELKPITPERVQVPDRPPIHAEVSWLDIIIGLWRREDEDALLDRLSGKPGQSMSLFRIFEGVKGNWKWVAIVLGALALTYLGIRLWG